MKVKDVDIRGVKNMPIDNCPVCGEILIFVNIGNGIVDIYCEECGWPDEDFDDGFEDEGQNGII